MGMSSGGLPAGCGRSSGGARLVEVILVGGNPQRVAGEDQIGAVVDQRQCGSECGEQRQPDSGRDDRDMRCCAAIRGGDPGEPGVGQRHQLRRIKRLGDKDRAGRRAWRLSRGAKQRDQDATFQIGEIVDARGKSRIAGLAQRRGGACDRLAPGEAGAFAGSDCRIGHAAERWIIEQRQMRGGYFSGGAVTGRLAFKRGSDGASGAIERGAFGDGIGAGLGHRDRFASQPECRADRHARRGDHAGQHIGQGGRRCNRSGGFRYGQQLAHAAGDQIGDRGGGAFGVRPGRADRDRRAVAKRQPQHRHGGTGRSGAAIVGDDFAIGLMLAGELGDPAGGPGMKPLRERQAKALLGGGACLHTRRAGAGNGLERHQRRADHNRALIGARGDAECFAVGDDHGRDQTARCPRQPIEIERDQRLSRRDPLALRHMQGETRGAQADGVEPDVH